MSERVVEKLSRQKATGKHRINFNSARYPAHPADPCEIKHFLVVVVAEKIILYRRKYTLYE
jgi:hypothetical protein